EMAADSGSLKGIAKTLNRESVLPRGRVRESNTPRGALPPSEKCSDENSTPGAWSGTGPVSLNSLEQTSGSGANDHGANGSAWNSQHFGLLTKGLGTRSESAHVRRAEI